MFLAAPASGRLSETFRRYLFLPTASNHTELPSDASWNFLRH